MYQYGRRRMEMIVTLCGSEKGASCVRTICTINDALLWGVWFVDDVETGGCRS